MKRHRNTPHETHSEIADQPCAPSCVSQDSIACKAHERYVQRGGLDGQDLEDWLAAERELLEESSSVHNEH